MDATQIILIVFIVLLIIIYPIMISARNKKENQRMQEQTNSLKRGDRVLTTSGVYGVIVDLQLEGDKKIVTIETGTEKKKGYVSVDAYAIYTIFKDEPEQTADVNQTETQPEPEKKVDEQNVAALNAQPEAEAQATDASQDEKQEKKAKKKEKKSKDKKVEEKKD